MGRKKQTPTEKQLARRYYDEGLSGSYTGLSTFRNSLPRKLKKKSDDWLRKQDAYNLHRMVKRKFPRTKIVTGGIDAQWQSDLIDLSKISTHNRGHRFLLTAIDCFSRHAWTRPLKNKEGKTVSDALSDIFDLGRVPKFLQTDQGKEYKNRHVQQLLKERGVRYFNTLNDDIKAGMVERFNRTILGKIYRYFTKNDTSHYLDKLQAITKSYNDTKHSAIGMKPSDVNLETQETVWLKLYASPPPNRQTRFKKGSWVRISKARKLFEKGYLPKWSKEIFQIDKVVNSLPPTFRLIDSSREDIKGVFYEEELIEAPKPSTYRIEAVLDRKKRGSGYKYLVKFAGYDSKHNRWVDDLQRWTF